MYDPKSEAREFVGMDRADAVAAACRFFDVEESELSIGEPSDVSGLGASVLVVAIPTSAKGRARAPREDDDRPPRGRGGRGRDDRERGGRGDRDRGDRGERGGRGDRGGRGGRGRDRDREPRRSEEPREPAPRAAAAPVEGSVGTATGELGDYGGFVKGVVEHMKLGPFEISEMKEDDLIVIQLGGDAAQTLSTAETRVGDAIQLLANQVSSHGGRMGPRVVVDVLGERERRESFLESLAERARDRAESTGRAVALDPMNGKDRRAVHMALREAEGIATMSIGEGQYRQVVVVPEGAEEYEEALRSGEDASRADD